MPVLDKDVEQYSPKWGYDQEAFDAISDVSQVPPVLRDVAKDASEALVFARQMEMVKNKVYRKKYIALRGREFVPASETRALEDDTLTYRKFDERGMAVLMTDFATDPPLVSAFATEDQIKAFAIWNAFGYSEIQLRKAAKAGDPLSTRDAETARQVIEEKIDEIIALGSPSKKTFGLLNNPNVSLLSLPTGSWSGATGLQMLADLNYMVNTQRNNTSEVEYSDTCLLGTLAYQKASQTFVDVGGVGRTVLEVFRSQNPGITVDSWTRCNTAAANGTTCRAVLYRRDSDVVEFERGAEFTIMPPERRNMTTQFPCVASMFGVQVHRPGGIFYADNINL